MRMKAIKLTEPEKDVEYTIVRTNLTGPITKEQIIAKHVEQLKEILNESFAKYDYTVEPDTGEMYSSVITYLITG